MHIPMSSSRWRRAARIYELYWDGVAVMDLVSRVGNTQSWHLSVGAGGLTFWVRTRDAV